MEGNNSKMEPVGHNVITGVDLVYFLVAAAHYPSKKACQRRNGLCCLTVPKSISWCEGIQPWQSGSLLIHYASPKGSRRGSGAKLQNFKACPTSFNKMSPPETSITFSHNAASWNRVFECPLWGIAPLQTITHTSFTCAVVTG